MSKFFCSQPFTNIVAHSTGETTPCCKFKDTQATMLKDYFSSKKIFQVKQQLLNNVVPEQCNRCYVEEAISGHSFRTMSEQFESYESEIRAINQADYFNIKTVTIGTSNVCNLQCLPCEDSSFVRDTELYNLGLRKQLPIRTINPNLDQVTKIQSIDRLTLLGGEPFADRVTMTLLEQLIEAGTSQNIRLDLNTNLTMITKEKLLLLKNNFKEVIIKGSIDGVGAYNDYLRYPSQWKEIVTALDLIKELTITFLLTTALSNLALLRFDQLIRWVAEQKINDVFITKVMSPEVLSCTRLPASIKQQILPRYIELQQFDFYQDRTAAVIDACIQMLKEPGCTETEWNTTVEWLKIHDQHRGTDYTELWPELNEQITY